jgi:hypothetical protein
LKPRQPGDSVGSNRCIYNHIHNRFVHHLVGARILGFSQKHRLRCGTVFVAKYHTPPRECRADC